MKCGVKLETLTWIEAEQWFVNNPVMVIPLGAAAKEHGPHLPLNNDAIIATWLAEEIRQRLPVVIAPLINASYYPAFIEYPGSISLRSETARGTQGQMQIYRVRSLIDIDRYQRINVLATSPGQVAAATEQLKVENNLGFLRQCIAKFKLIEFVDVTTDKCYLAIRSGSFEIVDTELFKQNRADETLREIVGLLAPDLMPG